MGRIPTVEENEDGWSDWIDVTDGIRLLCCDCMLAHDHKYVFGGGKIHMKVSRNDKSTAAARRGKGARKSKKRAIARRNTKSSKT